MAFGVNTNNIFKPEAQARIDKLGGTELLQQQDSVDHVGTRLQINSWLRDNQGEVNRQKAEAEQAEIQRAVNAVQSKMKVEEREAAKSKSLHAYDSFEHSGDCQPANEVMNFAKMAALVNGSSGLA